jgi:hypothetical protein
VEGLGIVDSAYIQRPEMVPLGAMATKLALDAEQLTLAEERMATVLDDFRDLSDEAKAGSVAVRQAEGNPISLPEQGGHRARPRAPWPQQYLRRAWGTVRPTRLRGQDHPRRATSGPPRAGGAALWQPRCPEQPRSDRLRRQPSRVPAAPHLCSDWLGDA